MTLVAACGFALVPTVYAQDSTTIAAMDKPVTVTTAFRVLGQAVPVSLPDLAAKNKAVVLVFLANRCGVTWLYADKIAALTKRYGKPGAVAVVGVHSNYEETDAELLAEMKRRGLTIPVLDDKKTQTLVRTFGATVTPYFVLIDAKGVLRFRGSFDKMGGSMPDAERPRYLTPALDAVLAGKPVAQKTVRALGCGIVFRGGVSTLR